MRHHHKLWYSSLAHCCSDRLLLACCGHPINRKKAVYQVVVRVKAVSISLRVYLSLMVTSYRSVIICWPANPTIDEIIDDNLCRSRCMCVDGYAMLLSFHSLNSYSLIMMVVIRLMIVVVVN
jgi:hypothetical protein